MRPSNVLNNLECGQTMDKFLVGTCIAGFSYICSFVMPEFGWACGWVGAICYYAVFDVIEDKFKK